MKTQNTRPMTNGEFVAWLVSQGVAEDVAAARINASDPKLPKRPLVDEVHDWTAAEIAAWKRSCMGLPPTATDAEIAEALIARDRAAKLAAIDARTAAGIAAGYPYAGKVFSASANHQTWALGLKDDIADGLDATGLPVPTRDNDGSHIIESNDDALALVAACKAHVRYWLASGSALKKAVQEAEDPSTINDNR